MAVTYRELLSSIESAVGYVSGRLGKKLEGRLPAYERLLRKVVTEFENGAIHSPENEQLRENFIESLPDVVKTISIYEYASQFPEVGEREQWRRFITGAPLPSNEPTQGDQTFARDTAFELFMQSHLAMAGCVPTKPDGIKEHDGLMSKQGYPIVSECKRVQSPKRIHDSLKIARKQLRDRQQAWKGEQPLLGIIFIDVSRLITGGNQLLRVPRIEIAPRILAESIAKVCSSLETKSVSFDSLSLLSAVFYADAAVYDEQRKLYLHVGQFTFNANSECLYLSLAQEIARGLPRKEI